MTTTAVIYATAPFYFTFSSPTRLNCQSGGGPSTVANTNPSVNILGVGGGGRILGMGDSRKGLVMHRARESEETRVTFFPHL